MLQCIRAIRAYPCLSVLPVLSVGSVGFLGKIGFSPASAEKKRVSSTFLVLERRAGVVVGPYYPARFRSPEHRSLSRALTHAPAVEPRVIGLSIVTPKAGCLLPPPLAPDPRWSRRCTFVALAVAAVALLANIYCTSRAYDDQFLVGWGAGAFVRSNAVRHVLQYSSSAYHSSTRIELERPRIRCCGTTNHANICH